MVSKDSIRQDIQRDGWFLVRCIEMIQSKRPLHEWPEEVADRFLCALFCGHHVNGCELDKALALHYHLFREHPQPNVVYFSQNDSVAERIRADLIGGVTFGAGLHLYEDVRKRCKLSLLRHRDDLLPDRK